MILNSPREKERIGRVSQKFKGKRPHPALGASPAANGPDPAATEAKVRDMIKSGKHKTAVDFAKDLYRAQGTPESEALLVDAYVARIQSLLRQDLFVEAKALIGLVGERHASARSRLEEVAASALASSGSIDELLRPLNDPELAPERHAAIERAIRHDVTNPGAIAASGALPKDHPLHKAAFALQRTLIDVTSGPVADDDLALPEVSHRSPLASWKVLVRAVAAFYRDEDDICRQALDAIRPESAPARLVPAIRAMLDGKTNPSLTPAAKNLVSSATGDTAALKSALEALDRSFNDDDENRTIKAIRTALPAMRQYAPERFEEFKQRIVVRCMMDGFEPDEIGPLVGGPVREDPVFMRLLARGMEQIGHPASISIACTSWDLFRQMAVEQGWFKANGPEAATLYLHMAEVLGTLNLEDLREVQRIAERAASNGGEDRFYLYPEKLYERACVLDPHAEAFSKWMTWAVQHSKAEANRVAEAWHKILPTDIEPILHLMEDTARRDKYPSALKYLAHAERIDAVNPRVRRARLRLMAGNAIRQIHQKSQRPADETIAAMAELPQAQQGDRPAFLAALRYMSNAVRGNSAAAAPHRAEIARLMGGDIVAALLIAVLAAECKRSVLEKLPDPDRLTSEELARLPKVVARVVALAGDMEVEANLPSNWVIATAQQFQKSCQSLDTNELRVLGDWALLLSNFEFAYSVSAEGLNRGGPSEAAFLLMRARSLPPNQSSRKAVCAAAAAELARQQRNMDIVDQAVPLFQRPFGGETISITLIQAAEVLKKEKAAPVFPKGNAKGPDYRNILPDTELCQCPNCRRARGEYPYDDIFDLYDEDEDEDIDESDDLEIPAGMPRELTEMFIDIARRAIERGQTPTQYLNDMGMDMPGSKKKKGRRK